jgi:hypothetical protein
MHFEEGYHVKGLALRYFTMTIAQQKKELLWLAFSTIINTVNLLFVTFKLYDFFYPTRKCLKDVWLRLWPLR